MRNALDQCDEEIEKRREKASQSLEVWQTGVERARRLRRQKERKMMAEIRANDEHYNARLMKLGVDRSEGAESQSQRNDKLKARIQASLIDQLEERRRIESELLSEAIEERHAAARNRRIHQQTKYNFLERSFGHQASMFDPKEHSVYVNRKSELWQNNAQAAGSSD